MVLHPTDFSDPANEAFRYALHLAKRRGTVLHLLHVVTSFGVDPVRGAFESGVDEDAFYQKLEEEATEKLNVLVEKAESVGVRTVTVLRRSPNADEDICTYAKQHEADLVVMGTHGRQGVDRLLSTSVSEEVVRQAPCDVLTVRGSEEEKTPTPVRRMLVPVDLSLFARPLLREAKEVAASFGAQVDLLHVIEPLPFPAPLMGAVTIHDLVSDPGERTQEQLDELIRTTGGPSVPIERHIEEGHAARAILHAADSLQSDMIVIASHGLSGLEGMLLGSVTARVIRKAEIPVWVARVEPEQTTANS